uniref:Uncharacterized protein n=1 Tax=Candidatus Kentrum sp. SD TaxID=2126332 RepID=A0A451BQ84_9GAMM|nr:MAG: hypothetical protein BECKSD772D_GA0070982_11116 [Candidatus Kentron sp. SD]
MRGGPSLSIESRAAGESFLWRKRKGGMGHPSWVRHDMALPDAVFHLFAYRKTKTAGGAAKAKRLHGITPPSHGDNRKAELNHICITRRSPEAHAVGSRNRSSACRGLPSQPQTHYPAAKTQSSRSYYSLPPTKEENSMSKKPSSDISYFFWNSRDCPSPDTD